MSWLSYPGSPIGVECVVASQGKYLTYEIDLSFQMTYTLPDLCNFTSLIMFLLAAEMRRLTMSLKNQC